MIRLVATLGLVLSLTAAASARTEIFPGYNDVCGYPIQMRPTPAIAEAVVEADGRRIIVLDPVLSRPGEADRRAFLVAHECAHHKLGHAEPGERLRRNASHRVVRDHEMSADCWAAETLARAGQERAIRLMALRFHRAGLYSPGGGYPAGIQRSSIILRCAAAGLR